MLAGKPGSRHVIRTGAAISLKTSPPSSARATAKRCRCRLTARFRYLAFRELKTAVENFKARAGGIVVLDAHPAKCWRWPICPRSIPIIASDWIRP